MSATGPTAAGNGLAATRESCGVLKTLLREMRIALFGYRAGDPLRCETCGRRVADGDAFRDAAGWPYCDAGCYERHYSHLL